MLHQIVTNVSFESFRERSAEFKVILLYPWANYRNFFLSYFLQNAKDGLLYYRIVDGQQSISDWLVAMVDEFDDVLGGFGANLKRVLPHANAATLGEALAADLNAFSKDPIVLYVDELDRLAVNQDYYDFMGAMVNTLAKNVQFAVSSRMLTYKPWYDLVANRQALVLGTEHHRNDMMFTIEPDPKPQLEIQAFGRGHAIVNGQEITNWDGALPRNLFFFFVDRALVTRDEIFETFWPNLTVKEATNVFHVTKRKITERISMKVDDSGNYELTQYSTGFYMPSDKVVRHYDVADFQEALERSMIAPNEREEEKLLRRAIELYRAPFLQTVNMDWVEERRQQLKDLYAQALIGLGRIHLRRDEGDRALGVFVRALRETPEREDIHREVMLIYMKLNQRDDARRQYQHLAKYLKETLNIEPSNETKEVYALLDD